MLYRIARFLNRNFALAVLWTYIGAFLIAFAFVFILPIVPLAMVFLGIGGLGVALLTKRVLELVEHSFARDLLAKERCPNCAAHRLHDVLDPAAVRCGECGSVYLANGTDYSYQITIHGTG